MTDQPAVTGLRGPNAVTGLRGPNAVTGLRGPNAVTVLYHPACLGHDAGLGHPERPERVEAVMDGVRSLPEGAVEVVEPRRATLDELALVHERGYVEAIGRFCAEGGGWLSADTHAGRGSWEAAVRSAGSGIDAAGRERNALCVTRPPGHHADARTGTGFCLFNNIAITAAWLAERGDKVVIVDWDAHHGNGTQDVFYSDDRVLYTSVHQYPLYPFTGRLEEMGQGPGEGYTINVPVPPGATGDVHLAAMDVVMEVAVQFEPTWVLVSCGFDSHRDDILEGTALALTSGDYAALTRRAASLAPDGHCVLFLEGGYDLAALSRSAAACAATLAGIDDFEPAEARSSGGPGMDVVEEVAARIG